MLFLDVSAAQVYENLVYVSVHKIRDMADRTSPQDSQPAVRVDGHSSFHDVSAGLLLRPVAGSVVRNPEPGQISKKALRWNSPPMSPNIQSTGGKDGIQTEDDSHSIGFALELKAEDIEARDEPVRLSGIPDRAGLLPCLDISRNDLKQRVGYGR